VVELSYTTFNQNYSMKKIATLLSFMLFALLMKAQSNVTYNVTTSGNCFPMIVTINVTSDDPNASTYTINSNWNMGGSWEFVNYGNPYSFVLNSSSFSLGIGVYAGGSLVSELYEQVTVDGNTFSLSATGSLPYTVAVGSAFPIQLVSNDEGITNIEWDFGNGQTQTGGVSANPTYTQAGTYNVTCTITSAECGTVVRTMEITASTIQLDLPSTFCVGTEYTLNISGAHPSTTSYFVNTPSNSYNVATTQVTLIFYGIIKKSGFHDFHKS